MEDAAESREQNWNLQRAMPGQAGVASAWATERDVAPTGSDSAYDASRRDVFRRARAIWGTAHIKERTDIMAIGPLGRRADTLICWLAKGRVATGERGVPETACFEGSLTEFLEAVGKSYLDELKHHEDEIKHHEERLREALPGPAEPEWQITATAAIDRLRRLYEDYLGAIVFLRQAAEGAGWDGK